MSKIVEGNSNGAYSSSRYLLNSIRRNECNVLMRSESLLEGISFEPSDIEKGGIIVFSVEVNALKQSDNKFLNKLKQIIMTTINKLTYKKKVDKIANDNNLVG